MRRNQASKSKGIGQSARSVDWLLRDAIRNKHLIEFVYQGLKRVAEPHDYGIQNGVKKLLMYQVRGESKSSRLPDWRMVAIDSMQRVRILDESFPGGRPTPYGEHKKWDQVFTRVASTGEDRKC